MKKTLIVSLLFSFVFFFSSCEKDDICDANTPTTPRLVIEFLDINNPTVLKKVTNLKVIGDGMTEGIVFNASETTEKRYLTNESKISIPLRTDANTTKYSFILNSGNSNPVLTDIDEVTFNYGRSEVFVSRACGFKTLFSFDQNPIIHTAVPASKPQWMKYISVEKSNIDNENETHIKIFF